MVIGVIQTVQDRCNAASGKSVIMRYIGCEYCKKSKSVYLVDLKTER